MKEGLNKWSMSGQYKIYLEKNLYTTFIKLRVGERMLFGIIK